MKPPIVSKAKTESIRPKPIKYTAVIDSIYVSNLDNPEQQVKELNLNFLEDTYRVDLVVHSESHDKKAFRIDQLRCHVQYKDGRNFVMLLCRKKLNGWVNRFTWKCLKRIVWIGMVTSCP